MGLLNYENMCHGYKDVDACLVDSLVEVLQDNAGVGG